MLNKPTVMKVGTWCFPVYQPNRFNVAVNDPITYPEKYDYMKYPNLLVSMDKGRSFALKIGPDVPERSWDEPMIMEKNDGSYMLFVRTYYGIAAKISYDKGETWKPWKEDTWSGGKPEAVTNVYRTGPSSRFFIRKLPSGRWLFVWHDHARSRVRLTAWLSEDEGKTWPRSMLLDERETSYPDGAWDDDGLIYIAYDHERYKAKEILLARFTEEDILAGGIKDSRSRMGILINKA
jgi:hypothetical protein